MPLSRSFRRFGLRLAMLLAFVGPGVITSNVDNDAGGIFTYSLCGAQYGYTLLWVMLPMALALLVIQEMSARMGVATGKGLADLIREQFGLRATFLIMMAVLLTNFGNTLAEFAGLASSLELFGISRFVSVPLGALAVWWLVVRGTYSSVEKAFLIACLVYLAYPISAFVFAKPDWGAATWGLLVPSPDIGVAGLAMIIGIIGTTIAPWQQFYLQSAVVEKKTPMSDYAHVRRDVIFGSLAAVFVAFSIVVACAATLHQNGVTAITSGADAAQALEPLAGRFARLLFAIGLANASLFAASILPLATAYSVCEGLGLEAGVDKKFSEAPEFYWLYTVIIVMGAAGILMPGVPLLPIILISQIVNGILLPFVLIVMVMLINDRDLMGEHVNGPVYNVIVWVTTVLLIALSVGLLVTSFLTPSPPG